MASPPRETMTRDPAHLQRRIDQLELALADAERVAEEARVAGQWHRSLFEEGLGLVCIHRPDGIIISVSPAAAASLEYESWELVGMSLADLLVPEFKQFFPHYLERLERNRVDIGMMRLLSKRGDERVWTYRNALMEAPDGGMCVVGQAQDLTALHRTRRELREARLRLEARVRQRTEELVAVNRRLQQEICERRDAEDRRQAMLQRLELLHQIAVRAATADTHAEIVADAIERCNATSGDVRVSFLSCDGGRFAVRHGAPHADGEWAVGRRVKLKKAYVELLSRGDPVISDVAALLAQPLRDGDRLVGAVCFHAPGPRSWSDEDVATAGEIAGFLALALRRSGGYPAIESDAA